MFSKKNFVFLLIFLFPINLFANQFEKNIEKLGLTLSGHYINDTMKNENGKYVLPSNSWFRKHISNDLRVFYKTGSGYGDWDGNGKLDYVGFGAGVACQSGGKLKEGRVGCENINSIYNPILPFSVNETFNFSKMRTVFDYNNTEKNGFASGVQRIIIEDFNGDGIDDNFVPNASVALNNGNFTYKAINHVFKTIK